jgi:septal ring factor EnvC (AmiA/AmiB activator)
MVHYEDRSKCSNLVDIIRVKDNDFFLKLWRHDRSVRALGFGMSLNEDRIADEIVKAQGKIAKVVKQNNALKESITPLKKEIQKLGEENKRLTVVLKNKANECKNKKDNIERQTKAIESLKRELRMISKSISKSPAEVVWKQKSKLPLV